MPTYKELSATHIDYNPELIRRLTLLYDGGYDMAAHASVFLRKLSIESSNSYKERVASAAYFPYLSQWTDFFASALFAREMSVRESADATDTTTLGTSVEDEDFYKVFAIDCDLRGSSFTAFLKDTVTKALYQPYALVGVDFTRTGDDVLPINREEEQALGLDRAYLYDIDAATLVDWQCGPRGHFDWAKLRNEFVRQPEPLMPPQKFVQFKLWTLKSGVAHYAIYESHPMKLTEQPRPSDDYRLVESGPTSFKHIPIFELRFPSGLHMGLRLGPICEEHFQRRTFLVSNMNKTCITIPVIKLGPEISAPGSALPSEVQSNPNRGRGMQQALQEQGYTVIGKDDDVVLREATGTSHGLIDKNLREIVDQMAQIVHQMSNSAQANTSAKAIARSATSKQADRYGTEILLSSYARFVADFAKRVYTCISEARGEQVQWSVAGLNTFIEEERDLLIQESLQVASIVQTIPSATFHKKYLTNFALNILEDYSPEEERTIQDEIEDAVDSGLVPTTSDGYGEPDGDEQIKGSAAE